MDIRFIGENVDKYENLVIGAIYKLIDNGVWLIDGEDRWMIVQVTAEESFKNFELVNE